MPVNIKTSLSIPQTLGDQAKFLAQVLKISRNRLFVIAIEEFIGKYQDHTRADPKSPAGLPPSQINQGDIYWVQLADASGAEPGIRHPHVVIQDNVINHSRVTTVVACALTTNTKRADLPGNILLAAGEANLPRRSVVEVSKVSTVDKARLGEYIGTLNEQRVSQILAGMRFLQATYFD